jgi:uncharacterized protein (TIGR00304 family)
VENETLIGTTLFLTGFLIIFIGFSLIIIGTVMGALQNSKAEPDYSKRTDPYGKEEKEADFRNPPDSENYHETPPFGKGEPEIKTGGVIMIGPIPIIFGSDKASAKTAIILAIVLMLLSLLLFRGSLF